MTRRLSAILLFYMCLVSHISGIQYMSIWSDNYTIHNHWNVDGFNREIQVWNNTLYGIFNLPNPKAIHGGGSNHCLAYGSTGAEDWWGYGFVDHEGKDISAFANGYLSFFFRAPNFYEDIEFLISDKYGNEYEWVISSDYFLRNDDWHLIELPLSEASQKVDFTRAFHLFAAKGAGNPGLVAVDEIVYRTSSATPLNNYYEHTFTESGTFVVPSGVTSINVKAWAGGGGGGSGNKEWDWEGGSGGGGGGYVEGTISVTPGQVINYTVGYGGSKASCESGFMDGGDGGDSEFLTIKSFGGKGGAENAGNSGAGGGGEGGTVHYGEYGHNGGNNYGGRGGNSPYGGHGGNGATGGHMSGWGGDGNIPGGGGGGGARWSHDSWCEHGGIGGRGEIKISYNADYYLKSGVFVVPDGVTELFVECWGAGGGGGGSRDNNFYGSGGGGGGYASGTLFVTPGDSIPYLVGVGGGRGGENGGNGFNGGKTQFLNLTAFGGSGGKGGNNPYPATGEGGSASGEGVYNFNFSIGISGNYRAGNNGNEGYGGKGAGDDGGNGGAQATGGSMSGWGFNGNFPGGGGGGGARWGDYPGEKGGRGANGAIRITYKEFFVDSPESFVTVENIVCANSDVLYTVNSNPNPKVTYNWSYSGNNSSFVNKTGESITLKLDKNATSGTLSVIATDGYGYSDELTTGITIRPIYQIDVETSEDEICKVATLEVSAKPITGSWSRYYLVYNDDEIDNSTNKDFLVSNLSVGNNKFIIKGKDENGCYVESSEKSVSVIATPNLWIGLGDNEWSTVSNWCSGVPANNNASITINSGKYHPKLGGSKAFSNVIINKNAKLEIMPGAKIDITGNLNINNEGQFILNNNYLEGGLASLKMTGGVIGNAIVKLTIPTNQWYYLSTPMTMPNTSQYGVGSITDNYVYRYSTNKEWVKEGAAREISNIAEGMLVYYEDNSSNDEITLEYTGILNTGEIDRKYYSKNYYLFGNPFPVSLNWQDENWVRNRIYGTIWYRTLIGDEMVFVTYNKDAPFGARVAIYPDNTEWGDESQLALIPPYQSVWIYTKTASVANPAEIVITDSQKAHGAITTLKSGSAKSKADIIRVVAQNDRSRDGTIIYFSEESEDKFDKGDSQKYFNSSHNVPEVYTRIGREAMAINGLPPFEDSCEVPLSVRNKTDDEVNLNFDLSHYNSDDVIVLYDRFKDEKINLRRNSKYSYTPERLGDEHMRFSILINPEDFDGNDADFVTEISNNTIKNIDIRKVDNKVLVSIPSEIISQNGYVTINNIEGIQIAKYKIVSEEQYIDIPHEKGVYLIEVNIGGVQKVKKVL